jgi:glycosyltransferase involved in cell wall biosynthesis
VPQLVEALAGIAKSNPELSWRAVIAGDGAVEETRQAIADAGLADRITIPGWVGPADADRLLRAADILTLPSFDENLPMSVIEGMAHGLAVVATPVGAVEDILADDRTGLLVPPGDAAALAEALKRLLREPDTRARLGSAARAFHAAHLEITPYLDICRAHWRAVAKRKD